jgi:1,4-dihydroxy-6-naphthoate synthase
MFWPLAEGLVESSVDGRNYLFSFEEADTHKLNQWASEGRADVCAVSAIHALRLLERYQPLRMGASVGDSYGPVIVTLKGGRGESLFKTSAESCLDELLLLTPGESTTAHAITQLLQFPFKSSKVVPIVPMARVFEELEKQESLGQPTAALLIHEGRLTFADHNCVRLIDIGEQWTLRTNASLPLGLNVVNRALSEVSRRDISLILRKSCKYAVEHREEFIRLAHTPEHRYSSPLSSKQLRHYLDLYANETTIDINPRDRQGFEELNTRAQSAGLLPTSTKMVIDWI